MEQSEPSTLELEVVRVISEHRLLDARSDEHVYWRRNGCGLVPGYYVVRRRDDVVRRPFNEDVEFRGPFRRYEDAEKTRDELAARLAARGLGGSEALRPER
jgi:hypothetical protein